MRNLIAKFICEFCKIFKIHIMVNLRLEATNATIKYLTENGAIRYCEFSGKTTLNMEK